MRYSRRGQRRKTRNPRYNKTRKSRGRRKMSAPSRIGYRM